MCCQGKTQVPYHQRFLSCVLCRDQKKKPGVSKTQLMANNGTTQSLREKGRLALFTLLESLTSAWVAAAKEVYLVQKSATRRPSH